MYHQLNQIFILRMRLVQYAMLCWLCCATAMQAQKPKVGLVLSGGGAKGLAHIGVLKAIDSAGLKIDYITGTSMGAIIGAMYAAGYSGIEIEEIAKNMNWNEILAGKPPYKNISIEAKKEYENYSLEIPFEGLKPRAFTGMREPQEVWLKFSEVFFPVYDIKDFSKFQIPFLCIATDLSNGKAVVLKDGDIVKAIRSSMAIPGVFSAVDYENTKLIDGGIVRNFPVRDVVHMGADYVIGVNLYSGLAHSSDMKTALDVMYQITNYRDAEDLVNEKRICDLIIEPSVGMFTAASFDASDSIINIGNKEGEANLLLFKQLAEMLNHGESVNHSLPKKHKVVIDQIDYQGNEKVSLSLLRHNLNIRRGEEYAPQRLNEAFRKAYATGYYSKLRYELIPIDSSRVKLNCIVAENPLSALKIGLSYHSFTNAALNLNYIKKNILWDRSESGIKLSVSEMPGLMLSHIQYFGKEYNNYFEVLHASNRYKIPVYDNSKLHYQYSTLLSNTQLNYGRIMTPRAELRVGGGFEYIRFNPSVASNVAPRGTVSNAYGNVQYHYNSFNKKILPNSGIDIWMDGYAALSRKYSLRNGETFTNPDALKSQNYYRLQLKVESYQSLHPRLSIFEKIYSGYVFKHNQLIFNQFLMGGMHSFFPQHIPFVGINEGQIFAKNLAVMQFGMQWRMYGDLYFLMRGNTGIIDFDNSSTAIDYQLISGVAASVAYDLSALPLEFSLMFSPEIGRVYVNAKIGFFF